MPTLPCCLTHIEPAQLSSAGKRRINMTTIPAKTILSQYMPHGWFGANYNMNLYKGCSHGCIYCDSRSECYGIEEFDTVKAKADALNVVERDLRSKRKTGAVITGSMSDPYNPHEADEKLTRQSLELFDKYRFGVIALTKSALVTRDIDILTRIKQHSPAVVNITITTFDDNLCRLIEPNVSLTSERFAAIRTLSDSGIQCGVLLMPILPFINDTTDNMLQIARAAKESGAQWILPSCGVTLRQNQRDYFYAQIDKHFPGVKQQYINRFGNTYSCHSPDEVHLYKAFNQECEKLKILHHQRDIDAHIAAPYEVSQLSFEL